MVNMFYIETIEYVLIEAFQLTLKVKQIEVGKENYEIDRVASTKLLTFVVSADAIFYHITYFLDRYLLAG